MADVAAGFGEFAGEGAFEPLGAETEHLGRDAAEGVELALVDEKHLGLLDHLLVGQRLLHRRQLDEIPDAEQHR
ncbi:hypothetical protein, partial [Nocardia brasiliensis]|uniref:hypothetical protein n=1 Tax=Nocardia brasiliensis TaxID=37326 RepID=UPI002453A4F7